MPSPFPGMDPFLEHPAIFPDLQRTLIALIREAINARLPIPYYASIASRTCADETEQPYLRIFADLQHKGPVAAVEVLSLENKATTCVREDYLAMQRRILDSHVHLVEIDLLRGGKHTTAVPREAAVMQAGPFDYHACIRAFDAPDDFRVYPVKLQEQLPAIEIPLLPPDTAISIELQPLLDRAYDSGRYARQVRYGEWAITPPLSAEQAAWAESVLREREGKAS